MEGWETQWARKQKSPLMEVSFVGEFKDDSFLNGTFYDKEGNIKSKMLNGKI